MTSDFFFRFWPFHPLYGLFWCDLMPQFSEFNEKFVTAESQCFDELQKHPFGFHSRIENPGHTLVGGWVTTESGSHNLPHVNDKMKLCG
jgi:hypothetical protein